MHDGSVLILGRFLTDVKSQSGRTRDDHVIFPQIGKRTVNSWFSSMTLGLFVMTTFLAYSLLHLLNFSIACIDLVCVQMSLLLFYLIKITSFIKMVSIAMMIGGAVVNALAFTCIFILFSSLKGVYRHDHSRICGLTLNPELR